MYNFVIMIASDLARIVTHYINQKGDTVSHKKLQKLLYYVEAWNLVHLGTPIIDEDFEAWVHGPVLPSLYHELKEFGYNDLSIVCDEEDTPDEHIESIIEKNKLSEDQIDIIYSVLDKYGRLNSMQLELLTHSEAPWINARKDIPPHRSCKNIISKEEMKEFYSNIISE